MGVSSCCLQPFASATGFSFNDFSGEYAFHFSTGIRTEPAEGGQSNYTYDTLNRLATLAPPVAITSGSFGYSYDALSRRTSLNRPNGLNTGYVYDTLSRLSSITHQKTGTTLDGASYTYDNAGNRASRTPLPGGTASNFSYDLIYELTKVMQVTRMPPLVRNAEIMSREIIKQNGKMGRGGAEDRSSFIGRLPRSAAAVGKLIGKSRFRP